MFLQNSGGLSVGYRVRGFPVGYIQKTAGYQYSLIVLVRVYRIAFERSEF